MDLRYFPLLVMVEILSACSKEQPTEVTYMAYGTDGKTPLKIISDCLKLESGSSNAAELVAVKDISPCIFTAEFPVPDVPLPFKPDGWACFASNVTTPASAYQTGSTPNSCSVITSVRVGEHVAILGHAWKRKEPL